MKISVHLVRSPCITQGPLTTDLQMDGIATKCSFSGWGQFATRDVTNLLVLLQKLCKNCPHLEKPFLNSKTISQIKFPNKIKNLSNHSKSGWAEKPFAVH